MWPSQVLRRHLSLPSAVHLPRLLHCIRVPGTSRTASRSYTIMLCLCLALADPSGTLPIVTAMWLTSKTLPLWGGLSQAPGTFLRHSAKLWSLLMSQGTSPAGKNPHLPPGRGGKGQTLWISPWLCFCRRSGWGGRDTRWH